ncbi:methyltransferase domain-containing protein [Streptomonospora nanhaiensis]|uniref:Protein-L-isoaspartate O-methyltransferase n=1 Tax=Streptomonospora nanhaiensis TaxID=1323731 RepID=A0A853BQB4_9ACTN|nr:methyltransferase domain-containing protein [Streptomonospora nanhaiensis]MBX9389874.1 methyltransferase domain-containing protein [Streptomonospora nanhaiensis]NYI96846.1 protein-L-isoaspartate(D-aspartate) O-methyltransferase [Streptomonospora nanhaiensis]
MTALAPQDWQPLAASLAERIGAAGTPWGAAFAAVPRHVFVPSYWTGGPHSTEVGAEDPRWLPTVYSDEPLTVQRRPHPDHPGSTWPTSSSSRPSLMLDMLQALEVDEGHRVLEIGTGTGYNAALLASRLGEDRVVSIDIDPDLVALARGRLHGLNLHPVLAAADGAHGWPAGAPYDRVIATHSVEAVPYPWVAQTRPGGLVLVDVRSVGSPHVGRIARLHVHEDGTARGGFTHCGDGAFMGARTRLDRPEVRRQSHRDLRDARTRTSRVGGAELKNPGLAFAVWAAEPEVIIAPSGAADIAAPDGSWATAPDEPGQVQVAGPRDLWALVEDTRTHWEAAGRPGIEDFTITVAPQGQTIALPHDNAADV